MSDFFVNSSNIDQYITELSFKPHAIDVVKTLVAEGLEFMNENQPIRKGTIVGNSGNFYTVFLWGNAEKTKMTAALMHTRNVSTGIFLAFLALLGSSVLFMIGASAVTLISGAIVLSPNVAFVITCFKIALGVSFGAFIGFTCISSYYQKKFVEQKLIVDQSLWNHPEHEEYKKALNDALDKLFKKRADLEQAKEKFTKYFENLKATQLDTAAKIFAKLIGYKDVMTKEELDRFVSAALNPRGEN